MKEEGRRGREEARDGGEGGGGRGREEGGGGREGREGVEWKAGTTVTNDTPHSHQFYRCANYNHNHRQ